MTPNQQALARTCLEAAEADSMTFPEIVGALIAGGFESYLVDFRRGVATYYLPGGDSVGLAMAHAASAVAEALDVATLQAAIREAQTLAPGYTYAGFCAKAAAAGCAAYLVSFLGRRALYFGRDGATHTEHFPSAD